MKQNEIKLLININTKGNQEFLFGFRLSEANYMALVTFWSSSFSS